MIQYVKRKHLDVDKYDACIEKSVQSRIYAFSWYLDIVAENWDVLVLDDYKAVMPIPWKQKYFIKYIAQPLFCQQLGVFSLDNISPEIQNNLIESVPSKFLKFSLNYNSNNHLNCKDVIVKKNYILSLNKSYEFLFKSFSKGRKHAVKVGVKNMLCIGDVEVESLINIKNEFYNYDGFSSEVLKDICKSIIKTKKGFILGVFKDEVLIGGGVFITSNDRITYLFSAFNDTGRKLQAASFLLNNIVKKNENSKYILDFEGGNITSIGSFFKSFGAIIEDYQQVKYNKLPFI